MPEEVEEDEEDEDDEEEDDFCAFTSWMAARNVWSGIRSVWESALPVTGLTLLVFSQCSMLARS